jgi:TPR repeat protein
MTTQLIAKKCLSCERSYGPDFVVCEDDGTQLAAVLTQSLVGDTLGGGKYELLEELGRGGMGVVFRARHKLMERIVAIKMLIDDMGKDPTALQRFHVEAKAASALNHANIIRIYDFDVSQHGFPFIVMDYLQGEPLDGILDRDQRMNWQRAMPLFLKVCDALGHAHRRQVVHRDMKPSNVMVVHDEDEGERPVVLDFGIAKLFTPGGKNEGRLTRTGEIFGSPLYMSPEQCLGQPVDHRSDIYSVACLIYETLTGCVPFDKSGFVQVILAHVNEPAPRLDRAAPELGLPKELSDVLMKAMAKSATERFESMAEFKQALIAASGGGTGQVEVSQQSAGAPAVNAGAAGVAGGVPAGTDTSSTVVGNVPNPYFQGAGAAQANQAVRPPEYTVVSGHRVTESDSSMEPQVRDWLDGAERGRVEDQFDLAWAYRAGDGVDQDPRLAIFWYTEAAGQGHPQAACCAGELYRDGIGTEQDYGEALTWFRKGAEGGDLLSQFNVGWAHEFGQGTPVDLEMAAYWYKKAAESGYSYAQNSLGVLYTIGSGVERDDKAAFELYLQAAEQGLAEAQRRLGEVYEWGWGVDIDYANALYWYEKAAAQDDLDAQFRLAIMTLEGRGCKPDVAGGKRKLRQAAQRGSSLAQNYMGEVYEYGLHDATMNLEEAFHWYKKATVQGHAEANYSLGLMFEEGRGTEVNNQEAERCFRAAAEGGSGNGMVALARSIREGRSKPVDPDEAITLLEKAMALDCGWAFMLMSQVVQSGDLKNTGYDALKLMEEAAALCPDFAMPHYELGILYIDSGRRAEGMECLRKAAALGSADAEDALASYEG